MQNHESVVKVLLAAGADVTAQDSEGGSWGRHGARPRALRLLGQSRRAPLISRARRRPANPLGRHPRPRGRDQAAAGRRLAIGHAQQPRLHAAAPRRLQRPQVSLAARQPSRLRSPHTYGAVCLTRKARLHTSCDAQHTPVHVCGVRPRRLRAGRRAWCWRARAPRCRRATRRATRRCTWRPWPTTSPAWRCVRAGDGHAGAQLGTMAAFAGRKTPHDSMTD